MFKMDSGKDQDSIWRCIFRSTGRLRAQLRSQLNYNLVEPCDLNLQLLVFILLLPNHIHHLLYLGLLHIKPMNHLLLRLTLCPVNH